MPSPLPGWSSAYHHGVGTGPLPDPGGGWCVGRDGATARLPGLRGLGYLHVLVSCPGTDVAALDLIGGEVVVQHGLGDVLDERARREFRSRINELEAQIADADGPSERAQMDALTGERDALVQALSSASALAGRPRTTGSTQERARIAVRKAIVASLARIAELDADLGRHLHERVRTGNTCRYQPTAEDLVDWKV